MCRARRGDRAGDRRHRAASDLLEAHAAMK
jgi:hypothetical protein